jgi:hypothetical protein
MKISKTPRVVGMYLLTRHANEEDSVLPGEHVRLVQVVDSNQRQIKDLMCEDHSVRDRMFRGCKWIGPLDEK